MTTHTHNNNNRHYNNSRKYPSVSRDKSIMDNLSDLVMLATVFENKDAIEKILDKAKEPLFTVVSLTLAMKKENLDIINLLLTHPNSKYESYSICATICMQRLQRLYQIVDVLEQINHITKDKNIRSEQLSSYLHHNDDSSDDTSTEEDDEDEDDDDDEYLVVDEFSSEDEDEK